MTNAYIDERNGGYYLAGTRVSLDSIVYAFRANESPETIRENFESLSLDQVQGAIEFYLAHQAEVDENIRDGELEFHRQVPDLSKSKPELFARLQQAREQMSKG